jgi:hypothetical protein
MAKIMKKIIQIAIDQRDSLYCLTEDGRVYFRKTQNVVQQPSHPLKVSCQYRTFWEEIPKEKIY